MSPIVEEGSPMAGYLSFPSLLLQQVPGIHGFSGRGESKWNSLVGWLKRSPQLQ